MAWNWNAVMAFASKNYSCGYCGLRVGPNEGYFGNEQSTGRQRFIYICSHCEQPTYFDGPTQVPGSLFGNEVGSLPTDVGTLYSEARRCMSIHAHTAAVLTCRKLLMNLAVNKGAKPGDSFLKYVEYLASEGFVPPGGKGWVDHIRDKGNEANHEIKIMSRVEAEQLISFSEMLLKFVYEFPSRIAVPSPAPS
jgi:hypothetical protein